MISVRSNQFLSFGWLLERADQMESRVLIGYPSGQDRLIFPVGDCPLRSRELKNLPVTAFPNS